VCVCHIAQAELLKLLGLALFCLSSFIFSRIKKGEGQGKEKCLAKSMMSKEANERLKRDTQYVPLRTVFAPGSGMMWTFDKINLGKTSVIFFFRFQEHDR
jgi:hypothetical protein